MQNEQTSGFGTAPANGGAGGEVAAKAGGVVADAKNAAGQVVEGLKARAATAADERKGTAVETLGTVAGALRGAAQQLQQGEVTALGTYADSAAQQLDKVAGYHRDKDLQGLTRDTETFARRHPEVFLGGAFLAGILAARFIKSSRPQPIATDPFNPPHFEPTGGQ